MDREQLRLLQAPLKQKYQSDPATAAVILIARGSVDLQAVGCRVELPPHDRDVILAVLHPLAGGDGSAACSGEMLLQALVSCAGTTLAAVAISMELPIASADLVAEGTMDFRGTLGVDRTVPVGITEIRLTFHLRSTATREQLDKLIQLTERYCVVAQTLTKGVALHSSLSVTPD